MKKLCIAFAALAMISGTAMAASDYEAKTICTPIVGNWVNAATENCQAVADNNEVPNRGNDYVRPSPPAHEPCDPKGAETKRS